MPYDYLMNAATVMFFICYIPELYANYKNKNANIYNLPEKVLVLSGTAFAFSYACCINDTVLISNYAPLLTLDIVALLMRSYYIYKNRLVVQEEPTVLFTEEPKNSSFFGSFFPKKAQASHGKLSAAALQVDTSPITQ